jgi:hypothetical protein
VIGSPQARQTQGTSAAGAGGFGVPPSPVLVSFVSFVPVPSSVPLSVLGSAGVDPSVPPSEEPSLDPELPSVVSLELVAQVLAANAVELGSV